jgi:hypothetical protein
MPMVLELELLLRGPAFVVLCLLLMRMLGLPRLTSAVVVGLLFTLFGGDQFQLRLRHNRRLALGTAQTRSSESARTRGVGSANRARS